MSKCPRDYWSVYTVGDGCTVGVTGDGDKLCATFDDFTNLQESPAGFGNTDAEAIAELAQDVRKAHAATLDVLERLVEAIRQGDSVYHYPPSLLSFVLDAEAHLKEHGR